MDVATWNVLHRIHAENWGDGPLARFPREADRIAAITAHVVEQLAAGRAVCMQEVSGDQLASVRAALPPAAQLFVLRYPRLPRPRRRPGGGAILLDPSEHLVTALPGDMTIGGVEATVFSDDLGKGYLAVALGSGGALINTHVSFGDKRTGQLAQLGSVGAGAGAPVVIVGDFNCDRDTACAGLGDGHDLAIPAEPALPTRPHKSLTIDHIAVRGGRAVACAVVDVDGLSDHNLVTATIR